MDIYQIRLTNALQLIDRAGSRSNAAERLQMTTNLLNQYLSQKTPKRIGDKLARRFEIAFDLAENSMDQVIGSTQNVEPVDQLQSSTSNSGVALRFFPLMGAIMPTKSGHGAEIMLYETKFFVKVPSAHADSVVYRVTQSSFGDSVRIGWYLCCSRLQPKTRDFVLVTGKDQKFLGECIDVSNNECTIDLFDDSKKRLSVPLNNDVYVVTAILPPSTETHESPENR